MESRSWLRWAGLPKWDVHARAFTHTLKGRPRVVRTVNLVEATQGLLGTFLTEPEESLNACLLDKGSCSCSVFADSVL